MTDLKTKRIYVKVTEREKSLLGELAKLNGFTKSDGNGDESKLLRHWINKEAKERGITGELHEISLNYFEELDDLIDISIDLDVPQHIQKEVRNFKLYMRGIVSELNCEAQYTFYRNGLSAFDNAWSKCNLDDEDEPEDEEEFGVLFKTIIEEHINFLDVMGFDMKSTLN